MIIHYLQKWSFISKNLYASRETTSYLQLASFLICIIKIYCQDKYLPILPDKTMLGKYYVLHTTIQKSVLIHCCISSWINNNLSLSDQTIKQILNPVIFWAGTTWQSLLVPLHPLCIACILIHFTPRRSQCFQRHHISHANVTGTEDLATQVLGSIWYRWVLSQFS